jgi:hypothetical protein
MDDNDDCCCASGVCKNKTSKQTVTSKPRLAQFLGNVRSLYAAALGIEILCIAAAETGENTGLYLLGFNHIGIPLAYVMGYGLATFTTFATILGRYQFGSGSKIDGCCSVLEQEESKGFLSSIVLTFKNFGSGLKKIKDLPKQPNLREILRSTLTILITAETACILTAETVDLIFFKQAIYLSILLSLLGGAFAVVAPEAYKKIKRNSLEIE